MKQKFYIFFDKLAEYSLYAVIFSLPICKASIEIFSVFVLLGFLGKKCLKPDFAFLKTWPNFFLLLFIIGITFSVLHSGPYLAKSTHALFLKWSKYIGLFFISQDVLGERKRFKRAVFVFLAGAVLVGLDGLSQKFLGKEFYGHGLLIKNTYGVTATFNHYNGFGSYLIVMMSLIFSLLISKKIKKEFYIGLCGLFLLLLACLLLTFSRGSWLGFLISTIFVMIVSGRTKESIIFLIVFVMGGIFIPGFMERLIYTFHIGGDAQRFEIWKSAWVMIKESPFLGKGLGTFIDRFGAYTPNLSVRYAHNCYLQMWVETGLLGLLSFLVFLSSVLYSGIKVFKNNHDFLLLGFISGMAGFLVASSLDTQLYSLPLATLFWIIMGSITARIWEPNGQS